MAPTTPLTAALILGVVLLAPTTAATASAESCRGERATIVGKAGGTIVGTEGRDVVVTNRSDQVYTRGGDDLVCITGPDKPRGTQALIDIETGAGNDLVDGTGAPDWAAYGYLGSGADTFYGGGADDHIQAGEAAADHSHLDSDRDILSGGGGSDAFTSGQPGVPNGDHVRLGQGSDHLTHLGTGTDPTVITGGPGADLLSLSLTAQAVTIDNASGRLTEDGRPTLGWSAFEGFSLYAPEQEGLALTFLGKEEAEHLTVDSVSATVTASFGGGPDSLTTRSLLLDGSIVDGGAGRDLLYVVDRDRILHLDLLEEVLTSTDSVSHRVVVQRVEDAELHARTALLEGTEGPNVLSASACTTVIRGLDGADELARSSEEWSESSAPCRRERYTINGGGGADELRGWRSDDLLVGGPGNDVLDGLPGDDTVIGGAGRDKADGDKGTDRCLAEMTTECER